MTGDSPMPADEALHPVAAHNDGGTGNVDSSTLVVCIDGPSGSGKSTVARGVARTLRLRYLDTGAMYRALTWAVSTVSAIPEVRWHMVALQRSIIGAGGIVVEGRDIGTAVCPDALVKVFLTASPEARAVRRFAEETDLVGRRDVAAVEAELARRDLLDSTRVASPLNKAPDAVVLDSTTIDVEGAVAFVVDLVARRLGAVTLAVSENE